MILTRKNPKAGRALNPHSFPFSTDEATGVHGWRIGYCAGCGEHIIIPTGETEIIANAFAYNLEEYRKVMHKLTKHRGESILCKVGKWLVEKNTYQLDQS